MLSKPPLNICILQKYSKMGILTKSIENKNCIRSVICQSWLVDVSNYQNMQQYKWSLPLHFLQQENRPKYYKLSVVDLVRPIKKSQNPNFHFDLKPLITPQPCSNLHHWFWEQHSPITVNLSRHNLLHDWLISTSEGGTSRGINSHG